MEKVTNEQKFEGQGGVSHVGICGKAPQRKEQCKGPETGTHLACVKISKEVMVARAWYSMREEGEEEQEESSERHRSEEADQWGLGGHLQGSGYSSE